MIVYLIGFMGSGKTSVGLKLARKLNREFLDLDEMIESNEGKSIGFIFEERGKEYFRKLEAKYLRQTVNFEDIIVACGGGTPCYHDNMDFMKSSGFTIYLMMTPSALKSRLESTGNKRPLIADMDENKLLKFIERKLDERKIWYEQSHLITDGLDADIDQIAAIVLSQSPCTP
ncbi:MAG TPA: shikimate kinase [Bacteroidales bacterium]|nr:shikimate kinase [Bacteroidales bacterium]